MADQVRITYSKERAPRGAVLKVVGVGGAGGNAINRMIDEGLQGVEFVAINTDIQDLSSIKSPAQTLQIGEKITRGLGTGSNADVGMQAALESTEAIIDLLEGANMVFITAGMGGGTGTGASQVVANHASSMGVLTVAVVTRPFEFEGQARNEVADTGIQGLMGSVDAIIVIPNQRLFELEDADISYKDAYKKVDEILLKAVRGISDIINSPGYQNVDFADVRAAMSEKGMTLMGTGEAKGENRAEEATRKALTSPLLENVSIDGATGILYNITAASNLTLKEIGVISEIIKGNSSPTARVKFGIVDDEGMGEFLRVTVIATGFNDESKRNYFQYKPRSTPAPSRPVTPMQVQKPLPVMEEERPEQERFVFKKRERSVNLTDRVEYINDSSLPSMAPHPENFEDMLDVPVFQRPKLTERK
ncbi:MAG: cell division protein FtsZ [Acidobacteriota bacterium]|jgi:cell division protein FtsZ|nr:cell division protein FtsZ [Acidobacteriota bacterium]